MFFYLLHVHLIKSRTHCDSSDNPASQTGFLRIEGELDFFGRLQLSEGARLEVLPGSRVNLAGRSATGGSLSLFAPLLAVPSRGPASPEVCLPVKEGRKGCRGSLWFVQGGLGTLFLFAAHGCLQTPCAQNLADLVDASVLIHDRANLTLATPIYVDTRDIMAPSGFSSGSAVLRERSIFGLAGSDAWLILDPGFGSYSLLGAPVFAYSSTLASNLPPDPSSSSGGRPVASIHAIGGQLVFLSGYHVVSGPLRCVHCTVSHSPPSPNIPPSIP